MTLSFALGRGTVGWALDGLVYTLVFTGLAVALLTAMIMPAPERVRANDAGVHLTLLAGGSLATVLTGLLALLDRPAGSAFCGAIAWLLVMPCVWLARAPRPAEEWGDESEDDDDGGSPWPRRPSAPPAPDDRLPGLRPSGALSARAAWAPPRAIAPAATPTPAVASVGACFAQQAQTSELHATGARTDLQEELAVAEAASEPVDTHPRLRARARPTRADHRSIVHVRLHARDAHAGRRRRASLRRRVLRCCRRWLWPDPPECATHVPYPAAEHDGHGRRRTPGRGSASTPSRPR